jgi:hypothetical protein
MNVTSQIHPSPDQAKAFFNGDDDGPRPPRGADQRAA